MDKTIRSFGSFDQMKEAEYREWQELPAEVRLTAASELSLALYVLEENTRDAEQRLRRTLVHLQRVRG